MSYNRGEESKSAGRHTPHFVTVRLALVGLGDRKILVPFVVIVIGLAYL